MERLWILVVALIAACSLTPRVPVGDNGAAAEIEQFNNKIALMAGQSSAAGEYAIGPEDLLEVTLFDIADQTGPRVVAVRVSNAGHVTLPFVGKVEAAGLSSYDFERELTKAYTKYIVNPQLSVFIKEYRSYQVSIVGYVENPGMYELRGRKSLLEGIALSGGINEEAGHQVRLTRQTETGIETALIDLDSIARDGALHLNVALLPGDVISVPQAGAFYVEGMVHKPGAYPLLQEITVSQAVATAGGADTTLANVSGAVLLRRSESGEREKIPLQLAAIQSGTAEDFLIQEDDVILVPMSGAKYFFDRAIGLLRFDRRI